MSAEINDGGPAFPVPGMPPVGTGDPRDGMAGGFSPEPGMTLRDWFAGMALNGCQRPSSDGSEYSMDKDLAEAAYEVADAMIAARKVGGQ